MSFFDETVETATRKLAMLSLAGECSPCWKGWPSAQRSHRSFPSTAPSASRAPIRIKWTPPNATTGNTAPWMDSSARAVAEGSQCPPGTEVSKVSWVGTCHNGKDGKDYLISYNDCCGRSSCGQCYCSSNLNERPGYEMGVHNDVNWCMANGGAASYHCTVSIIVGVAG